MGRKAGVTAEQTRSALLNAAARVFARKGYDGASIADITTEAELSSGSIYAHYASKAELFVAVVKAHGHQEFVNLTGLDLDDRTSFAERVGDVGDFFTLAGRSLDGRAPRDAALMIEAIVASKRHPEVAELIGSWIAAGEAAATSAFKAAQAAGIMDPDMDAAAASRFVTMVSLGARLTAALDVPPVGHAEWSAMIEKLVNAGRVKAP